MSKRTTLLLDDDTLAAAQALALQYSYSTAEAIRKIHSVVITRTDGIATRNR